MSDEEPAHEPESQAPPFVQNDSGPLTVWQEWWKETPDLEDATTFQVMVGQAGAQIATAIAQAHDASVRIEEFGAGATTPQQRDLADQLAADNQALLGGLTSINETLRAIRADGTKSGNSTTRYNRAFVIFGVLGLVGVVLTVLQALNII